MKSEIENPLYEISQQTTGAKIADTSAGEKFLPLKVQ